MKFESFDIFKYFSLCSFLCTDTKNSELAILPTTAIFADGIGTYIKNSDNNFSLELTGETTPSTYPFFDVVYNPIKDPNKTYEYTIDGTATGNEVDISLNIDGVMTKVASTKNGKQVFRTTKDASSGLYFNGNSTFSFVNVSFSCIEVVII